MLSTILTLFHQRTSNDVIFLLYTGLSLVCYPLFKCFFLCIYLPLCTKTLTTDCDVPNVSVLKCVIICLTSERNPELYTFQFWSCYPRDTLKYTVIHNIAGNVCKQNNIH